MKFVLKKLYLYIMEFKFSSNMLFKIYFSIKKLAFHSISFRPFSRVSINTPTKLTWSSFLIYSRIIRAAQQYCYINIEEYLPDILKKKKHKKDNKNIFMYICMYITKKRQSIFFFRWPVMKVSKPRTSYKVVAPLQANSLFLRVLYARIRNYLLG